MNLLNSFVSNLKYRPTELLRLPSRKIRLVKVINTQAQKLDKFLSFKVGKAVYIQADPTGCSYFISHKDVEIKNNQVDLQDGDALIYGYNDMLDFKQRRFVSIDVQQSFVDDSRGPMTSFNHTLVEDLIREGHYYIDISQGHLHLTLKVIKKFKNPDIAEAEFEFI